MAQNDDWWASDVASATRERTPKQRKEVTEATVGEETAPATVRKEKAEALSAEAKAELDALKVKQAKAAEAAGEQAQRAGATKRAGDIENLLFNVNQARQNLGPTSTGPIGQIARGFWSTEAQDLGASLEGITSPIVIDALAAAKSQSKTGASGFGALSERELSLLQASIASLKQSQSQEQLLENLNRVEYHFRRFQAFNNGFDPETPEGAFYAGLAPVAKEEAAEVVPPEGGAPKAGKFEPDPERAGLNATISSMIRAGRTAEQIRAWANDITPGLGERLQGLESNIAAWKQDPNFQPNVDVERKFVPAEGLGKAAAETLTTGPGAAAAGFTDVFTAGTMDELTGGPRSRATMQYAAEKNPELYTLGQFGGGVAQALTGSALLKPLLTKYGALAPWVADVAQGGAYGAGSAEGDFLDRLGGAATGAATGLVGGKVARGLGDITSGALRGAQNRAADLLAKYDVPMSLGQVTGGAVKETEERLMGMPYVGTQIGRRRNEALEGFNRAAFNEAVAPLGAKIDAIGPEGVQAAQEVVERAYKDALDGLAIQVDQPMVQVLRGQPYAELGKIPRVGKELAEQVDSVINDFVDTSTGVPVLTGENLQAAWRSLRSLRQSYKTDPQFGQRIAPALSKIEDAFTDAMQRQAPDRAPLFLNANEAYKRTSIIGDTVDFAGDVFTPSQLNVRSRQVGRTFGGKAASQRGDRPFYELIRAGRSTMPSQVKDPGTAGQLALPLAAATLTGGGTLLSQDQGGRREGEPRELDLATPITYATLAGLLAGAPYSRAGQRALTNIAMAPRPQIARDLGSLMARYTPTASRGVVPLAAQTTMDRVPQPDVPYVPPAFEPPPGMEEQPVAVPTPGIGGGYYDEATDTYVLSDGTRVRSDGTIVE